MIGGVDLLRAHRAAWGELQDAISWRRYLLSLQSNDVTFIEVGQDSFPIQGFLKAADTRLAQARARYDAATGKDE